MSEIQTRLHRILIVDDDMPWRNFIRDILLREELFIVDLASELGDFYTHLRENPRLVILNYDFHERVNSREILRTLTAPRYSNVPVIMLTGRRTNALQFPRKYKNVMEVFIKGGKPSVVDEEFVKDFIETVKRHLVPRISWLHISDLHIGRQEPGRDWQRLREAFINDLEDHKNSQTACDDSRLAGVPFHPSFLFITGDITWTGSALEYEQAQEFLTAIWEATDLSPEQTFMVPGNHDISRSACTHSQVFLMAYERLCDNRQNDRQWHDDLRNIWGEDAFQQVLSDKHREYLGFARWCQRRGMPSEMYYTEQTLVGNTSVEIVGVNSALMCHKDDEDLERGLWIGMPQIEALRAQGNHRRTSNDRVCRIFLVHHPNEALHYFDESAWQYMQQYGAIILHGHLHKSSVNAILQPDRRHVLIPGGSVHQGGTWVSQRYNYVEYNHQAKVLYMYFRKTTTENFPQYIRDNETFPEEASEGYVILRLDV